MAGVRATSMVGFAINVGSYYVFTRYVPFFDAHEITTLLAAAIFVAAPADARDRQPELRAADVAQHNHWPVKSQARRTVDVWMQSPRHRENILTPH